MSSGWGVLPPVDVYGYAEERKDLWLISEIFNRNFPGSCFDCKGEGIRGGVPCGTCSGKGIRPDARDIRKRPANTNIVWSGQTQQGKSTGAAKMIYGCGDKTFLPSLKNHPAFTGDVTTSWKCHLSVSPLPFVKALRHDLKILQSGSLKPRELPPGSKWLLDEPIEVDSLMYWDKVAKAMSKFVTMFAFMGVDLIVITPIKDKILGRLQGLAHIWINQKSPGHADVWSNVPWIDTKSKRREQFMRPVYRCEIDDERNPPREWMELYPKIKTYNAAVAADEMIDDLGKSGIIV